MPAVVLSVFFANCDQGARYLVGILETTIPFPGDREARIGTSATYLGCKWECKEIHVQAPTLRLPPCRTVKEIDVDRSLKIGHTRSIAAKKNPDFFRVYML